MKMDEKTAARIVRALSENYWDLEQVIEMIKKYAPVSIINSDGAMFCAIDAPERERGFIRYVLIAAQIEEFKKWWNAQLPY